MAKEATLVFEEARFDAAVSDFLRRLLPELVDTHVRKMAFDVVDQTAQAMTKGLDGLPKRVDTGRLRAGWRVALEDGRLPVPRSVPSSVYSMPGDGDAALDKGLGGKLEGVEVRNNVEYSRDVEEGTDKMSPGHHLERALRVVRIRLPRAKGPTSLNDDMQDAWHGRTP